jgi:phospholipase/carboxylesterase
MSLDGPRVPAASGRADSLIVLVHGYGSNGEDLISLAPFWQGVLPNTAFVSPNAPQICPGAPGGYQWWDIASARGDRMAGVRTAAPLLDAFIDAELAGLGLTGERLALVGFSQGTMMSLQVAPRRPVAPAGVVGYSGRLIGADRLAAEAVSKPPILLVHGQDDPMVPVQSIYEAKEAFEAAGFDVSGYIAPGLGHSIDQAGLQLGGQFLHKVLVGEAVHSA